MDEVVLVNDQDEIIGTMEKMEAHQLGLLHRAFSILIFNARGEMLIQKRAASKYHSAGLWTNACCSHPKPGETMELAVNRRLLEELGIHCKLDFVYKFSYRAEFASGLIENEIDYVYLGIFDGNPVLNPLEVEDFQFMALPDLKNDIQSHPDQYTEWFKLIINHYHPELKRKAS